MDHVGPSCDLYLMVASQFGQNSVNTWAVPDPGSSWIGHRFSGDAACQLLPWLGSSSPLGMQTPVLVMCVCSADRWAVCTRKGPPKAAPLSSGGALQVAALVAEHMLAEVDAHQLASDAAAAQVWKGAEDGRLMRVLVRLGSVLERLQAEGNPQWAETGMAMQTVQGGLLPEVASCCVC